MDITDYIAAGWKKELEKEPDCDHKEGCMCKCTPEKHDMVFEMEGYCPYCGERKDEDKEPDEALVK